MEFVVDSGGGGGVGQWSCGGEASKREGELDTEGGGSGEVAPRAAARSVEPVGGVCECWGRCWPVLVLLLERVAEEREWQAAGAVVEWRYIASRIPASEYTRTMQLSPRSNGRCGYESLLMTM